MPRDKSKDMMGTPIAEKMAVPKGIHIKVKPKSSRIKQNDNTTG